MFEHPNFDRIEYDDLPVNRDIYLIDESYMEQYERMMLRFFDGAEYEIVGTITDISIKKIQDLHLDIRWVANIYDRFHTIEISLPRDQIVQITGCRNSDEKVRIFIKSEWLKNLHSRSYCIFGLIDSAGMKNAIRDGVITRQKLLSLRADVDKIAAKYKDVMFVSFADSVVLKYSWKQSFIDQKVNSNYTPEHIISISKEVGALYFSHFGLKAYAILSQGVNEFYDDDLLHISNTSNHVSLNSFGTPFAQLQEIETNARQSIRLQRHEPCEVYIEEHLFWSLKFRSHEIKQGAKKYPYQSKISADTCFYYPVSNGFLEESLR